LAVTPRSRKLAHRKQKKNSTYVGAMAAAYGEPGPLRCFANFQRDGMCETVSIPFSGGRVPVTKPIDHAQMDWQNVAGAEGHMEVSAVVAIWVGNGAILRDHGHL